RVSVWIGCLLSGGTLAAEYAFCNTSHYSHNRLTSLTSLSPTRISAPLDFSVTSFSASPASVPGLSPGSVPGRARCRWCFSVGSPVRSDRGGGPASPAEQDATTRPSRTTPNRQGATG